MFESLFSTGGNTQNNTSSTSGGNSNVTVTPSQNQSSNSGMFSNLFSGQNQPQVNPFASLNQNLDNEANPQPTKQQQPVTSTPVGKTSSGNFFQDAGSFLSNLFGNTVKTVSNAINSPQVKGAEQTVGNAVNTGVSDFYHTVLSGQSGSAINAVTSFPIINNPLPGQKGFSLNDTKNVIDQIFKLPDEGITTAQNAIFNASKNTQNGGGSIGDKIVSAIAQSGAAIQGLNLNLQTNQPSETSLGGAFGTEYRGIQEGITSQYLGDSKKVMATFNTPLDKPVTQGGKIAHTVGDVVGNVLAFIAGGEVLKAAGLGKAVMPVLFTALGQTSSPSTTTALQRIEKAPVDALTGWLFGGIHAPTGVKSALSTTAKAAAVGSSQQFINSVIQGQKGTDAAKTAATMGVIAGLFHIAGSATGLIQGKLFDSSFKQGVIEMSPQEVQHQVVNTDLKGTPEGEALMKMSLDAQQAGKNLRISVDAAKQAPLANMLNMKTPSGIAFHAELVDAAPQVANGEKPATATETQPQNAQSPMQEGQIVQNNLPTQAETTAKALDQTNTAQSPTNSRSVGETVPSVPEVSPEVKAVQASIRTPETFKSPEEQSAFTQLKSDPIAMRDSYIKRFGNEINPDLALKLFPEYKGYNSGELSRVSGTVKDLVYNHMLKTEQGQKNNTVVLNAGGSGSGKTSAVNADAKLKDDNAIVLDTTFSNNSAPKDVKKALDNGYRVQFNFVLRPPTQAWENGVLPRTKEEGRVISEGYFLRSHVDALRNLQAVYQKYKDNPRVGFDAYSNGEEGLKRIPIDELSNVKYDKKEIAAQMKVATDKAYETGELTKEQYTATTSDRAELEKYSAQSERSTQQAQETATKPSKVEAETNDAADLVREALYTGDIQAAQAIHDSFPDLKLPSFEKLQAEVQKLHDDNIGELKNIQKELEDASISQNPDDPTNQLKLIAQQLQDHFSRPYAKLKVTGTERTYTGTDGKTMIVGGNATEAFDRLINATDITGFAKKITKLHQKFDGVFSKMYDSIRSGGIDGGDYEQFKDYYESIQGKRFSNAKTAKVADYKANNQLTQASTSGNTLQHGIESEATQTSKGVNQVDRNDEITQSTSSTNEPTESSSGNNNSPENIRNGSDRAINSEQTDRTPGNGNSVDIGEPENDFNPQRGSVQLNVGIDPGLNKFFSDEIQPAFHAAEDIKNEWSNTINPPKASEMAAKAANAIRKAEAHIANYRGIIKNQYHNYEKFFNKYSDVQNVKNISEYERTGKFAIEPTAKAGEMSYSELYKKSMAESYQVLLAAYGKNQESFIENYVRRQFVFNSKDDEAKGTTYLTNYMRSLSASKSPLKQRVLDMPLDEALQNMKDRDIKVKMVSSNPEALRQWSLINAQRALAYKTAWNDAKASALIKFVPRGGQLPEGFVPLNDRAAEVFAPAEVHYPISGSKPIEFQEKGYQTTMQMGKYYADPNVARIFNNAISRGFEGSKTYQAFRYLTNTLSQFQLGLSAFHLGAVGIDAGVTDISIGLRYLIQGRGVLGISHIGTGIVPFASFAQDMYHGQKLITALKNNDPLAAKFLEEKLNPAGGRLGLDEHYRNEMWQKINHAVLNGNPIGATIRTLIYLPQAIIQTVSKPLLEYAVPRVKIGAFMDLAEAKLSQLPPDANDFQRRQALVAAWTSIDNRMGQLAYSNLFWHKGLKDLSMMSVRSVGWDLGTVRELGGAVIDSAGTIRGKGVTDRMLWGASLVLYAGLLGAIYMFLHTGRWPQSFKDYMHPQNGLTDKNGNPDRISLPTYLKDIYSYTHDPLTTSINKASPLLSWISSMVSNKDYFGNLIRNPNDPVGTQLAQLGQYALAQIIPFSVQQAQNKGNGNNLEQKIEGFFGIIKAPQSAIQSNAQKALIKAYQNQVGLPAPKTPEQVQVQNLKTQARQEIQQTGDINKSPSYRQLIDSGALKTVRQRQDFLRTVHQSSMQRMSSHLPKAVRAQFLQSP